MALTLNAVSTQTGQTDFSTKQATKAHTFNSNSRRLALVCVQIYNDSLTAVTVGGVAASLVNSATNGSYKTYIYQLVAPATGSQNVVITTATGSVYYILTIIDFYDVDQDNPINVSATNTGASGTISVAPVTTIDGCIVIDSFATPNFGTNTVDGSQTQRSNLSATFVFGGTSSEAAASDGTVTMSWTNNYPVPSSVTWATVACAVAPYTGKKYSRGSQASLPTNTTNMSTLFTQTDYDNAATDDASRAEETGSDYVIHLFKYDNANNTDNITIDWNGQCADAPSSSTVYLQIWNSNSSSWETLDSDNTTGANTDFDLSGSITSSQSNYYTGSDNTVIARVYQQAA